jgi:hypothetical protein
MKEFAWMSAVLVLWIVLNRWVLPWFGVPTCMSGGCAADRCVPSAPEVRSAGGPTAPGSQGDNR